MPLNEIFEIDWNEIFDKLKNEAGTPLDEDLAEWLEIRPEQISKARKGREELPIHAKYIALNHAGYFLARDAALQLLPKKAREKVLIIERNRTNAIMRKRQNDDKNQLIANTNRNDDNVDNKEK